MNLQDQLENSSMKKGFTLIELLIVIAIISIVAVSTTPFLSRFVLQTNYDSTVNKLASSLRKAQTYAMEGKNNTTWGVCLTGNMIRLYGGTCASPTTSENFAVPSSITISNLTDVTFNRRGEPNTTLAVDVTSSIESQTVTLNAVGNLAYNGSITPTLSPVPTSSPTPGGPTLTNTPAPTSTPTSTPTNTPVPTVTSTPTPTSVSSLCNNYCITNSYSAGTCRENSVQCSHNGETYKSGGDTYCTGGPSADTCCCL